MSVACRMCGKVFNWENGEGYAKDDNGYLCSMSCEFREFATEKNSIVKSLEERVLKLTGKLNQVSAAITITICELTKLEKRADKASQTPYGWDGVSSHSIEDVIDYLKRVQTYL